MKKIVIAFFTSILFIISLSGCSKMIISEKKEEVSEKEKEQEVDHLQIVIQGAHQQVLFQLNNSEAAKSLYNQLPLTIDVENYSNNEKIFYPPQKLTIVDTPIAEGSIGTLAYYEPWGDVVIYYGEGDSAEGLYALGEFISGAEQISQLTGKIKITQRMRSQP